jgi:NAD(P)-dependent dehydrogenase (short-subunit alcohol dehydrogenase family)
VTGGTKGIGWAVADELLALGATVTIAARGEQEVSERLRADIPESCSELPLMFRLRKADSLSSTLRRIR